MYNLYGWLKQCFYCLVLLILAHSANGQAACPPNIGFENGDFSGWQCYLGNVTSTQTTNTVNVNPSPPIAGHHNVMNTTQLDPYGFFPMVAPGSTYSARLGFTNSIGAEAERLSYTFTIPSGTTTYSLTYQYAVVFQEPNHDPPTSRPRFEAKVYDVTTGQYLNCASYEFVAQIGAPGFQISTNNAQGTVYYRPWTAVTMILSDYVGHTIRIEFTNADCTATGHWAYCYVDVKDNCSNPIIGNEYCPGSPNTTLTAPFGYNTYNWFNQNFGTPIATTPTLTIAPVPTTPTVYAVEVIPQAGLGCRDTVYATVQPLPTVPANAGADRSLCTSTSQGPLPLGTASQPNYNYAWTPTAGLSDPYIAQPTPSPSATTQYILTVTDAVTGCTANDTVNVVVAPPVSTSFTSNTTTQCVTGNSFQFTGPATNPAGTTVSWNFGDNTAISNQSNPSHVYTTPGTYTVKLTVASPAGCIDSSSQTVVVTPLPTADAGSDKTICSNSSTTIGSPAIAGLTYSWSPATGLSSTTAAEPTANPSATTQYILTVTGAAGCVKKDTVNVNVVASISPAFTINASSQCLNVNSFQFTSSPSNPAGLVYSWTFGDGVGVSTQASPTYSYTSIGTYTVKLVVSAAGGTCKDSSTQTVTVNAVPVAVAGADALLCAGTSQTAPLGGPAAAGVTYSWSPAAGLSSATASNPTAQPTTTTQYIVTATGAGGCFTKDTVVVTVVQTINPAFTVNSSTQCLNVNNFSFTGTSSNAAGLVYTWTFGDGAGATGVTASHSYAALGSYTVKLVVSTPTGSCKDSSTQTVTVAAVPVATAGSDQTICAGASTTIGGAATAGVTYSWSPATGLSSATASNPTASPSTTTQYIVTATGAGTCASKDTVLVTVLPTLQPAFTVNNATQCITGNSFVFTMSSPASGLSYAWTFGDGVGVSTQQNPSYSYTAAGTYTVTLTLSNANGCSTTSTKTVTVNNLPVGAITAAGSNICEGTPVVLSASGTATSFKWYKDGVLVATTPTGSYNALAAGNYTVTLDNGCPNPGTGQVTLTLTKKPVVDFSFTTMCLGYPTPFTDKTTTVGSGTVSYSWNFQDPSLPSSTQTSPTVTYGAAGTYNVGLTVTPQLCPSLATTVTKPVVIKGPEVGITYTEKAALENVPLQLSARNIGVGYVWSPATLLNKADIRQPVFKGAVDQQYTITITDDRGCVTVDTQLVKVYKEVNVYMPKGFSPNGDGLNDYIHPFTVGIKEIRLFRIINRWGVTVFEARGTAAQTGWDGRYKGTPQPMDGFVWEIQAIDFFGKQHVKQGSFTLLR